MHVGMEEAVAEHLVEERLGADLRMTTSGSWPAAAMASRSSIGMPSIRSSVSTRSAVRSQSMVGAR